MVWTDSGVLPNGDVGRVVNEDLGLDDREVDTSRLPVVVLKRGLNPHRRSAKASRWRAMMQPRLPPKTKPWRTAARYSGRRRVDDDSRSPSRVPLPLIVGHEASEIFREVQSCGEVDGIERPQACRFKAGGPGSDRCIELDQSQARDDAFRPLSVSCGARRSPQRPGDLDGRNHAGHALRPFPQKGEERRRLGFGSDELHDRGRIEIDQHARSEALFTLGLQSSGRLRGRASPRQPELQKVVGRRPYAAFANKATQRRRVFGQRAEQGHRSAALCHLERVSLQHAPHEDAQILSKLPDPDSLAFHDAHCSTCWGHLDILLVWLCLVTAFRSAIDNPPVPSPACGHQRVEDHVPRGTSR
jgi:hypothetical protein